MNPYNNHRLGKSTTLTLAAQGAEGFRAKVDTLVLNQLWSAIANAGLSPDDVLVQGWMRHDSWADVGGLVFTSFHNPRLATWLRAWCAVQYKKSSRCTDWNSYYCLTVEYEDEAAVWLKTSSYNIGD